MNLNDATATAGEGIAEGDADVRMTSGVDDEELNPFVGPFCNRVDEFTFVVGLKETGLSTRFAGVDRNQLFQIGKRLMAVDLGLAFTESIEIGSIDDADFHGTSRKDLAVGGKMEYRHGAFYGVFRGCFDRVRTLL